MASDTAERFMQTLQHIESTGDPAPMAGLFADDAELSNLGGRRAYRGRDGAVEFWRAYLDQFDEIRSDFGHVTESPDGAAAEWVSHGRLASGRPLRYSGVSVLEFDGSLIRRFRTYYDSAAFVAPVAEAATA